MNFFHISHKRAMPRNQDLKRLPRLKAEGKYRKSLSGYVSPLMAIMARAIVTGSLWNSLLPASSSNTLTHPMNARNLLLAKRFFLSILHVKFNWWQKQLFAFLCGSVSMACYVQYLTFEKYNLRGISLVRAKSFLPRSTPHFFSVNREVAQSHACLNSILKIFGKVPFQP